MAPTLTEEDLARALNVTVEEVRGNHDTIRNFLKSHYLGNDKMTSDLIEYLFISIYGFLSVSAIVSNLVILVVILRTKKLMISTNLLLINLLIADLFLAIFCIPFTLISLIRKSWKFGYFCCKMIPLIQSSSVFSSSITIATISIDRLTRITSNSVTHHEGTNRSSRINNRINYRKLVLQIMFIWITSIIISIPQSVYQEIEIFGNPDLYTYEKCTENWPDKSIRATFTIIITIIQLMIPTSCLIISYFKIKSHLNLHFDNITKSSAFTNIQIARHRNSSRVRQRNSEMEKRGSDIEMNDLQIQLKSKVERNQSRFKCLSSTTNTTKFIHTPPFEVNGVLACGKFHWHGEKAENEVEDEDVGVDGEINGRNESKEEENIEHGREASKGRMMHLKEGSRHVSDIDTKITDNEAQSKEVAKDKDEKEEERDGDQMEKAEDEGKRPKRKEVVMRIGNDVVTNIDEFEIEKSQEENHDGKVDGNRSRSNSNKGNTNDEQQHPSSSGYQSFSEKYRSGSTTSESSSTSTSKLVPSRGSSFCSSSSSASSQGSSCRGSCSSCGSSNSRGFYHRSSWNRSRSSWNGSPWPSNCCTLTNEESAKDCGCRSGHRHRAGFVSSSIYRRSSSPWFASNRCQRYSYSQSSSFTSTFSDSSSPKIVRRSFDHQEEVSHMEVNGRENNSSIQDPIKGGREGKFREAFSRCQESRKDEGNKCADQKAKVTKTSCGKQLNGSCEAQVRGHREIKQVSPEHNEFSDLYKISQARGQVKKPKEKDSRKKKDENKEVNSKEEKSVGDKKRKSYLKHSSKSVSNKGHQQLKLIREMNRNEKVTNLLFLVTTSFILCWLPWNVINIIIDIYRYNQGNGMTSEDFQNESQLRPGYTSAFNYSKQVPFTPSSEEGRGRILNESLIYVLLAVSHFIAMSSPSINAILYGFFNPNIRREFKKWFSK